MGICTSKPPLETNISDPNPSENQIPNPRNSGENPTKKSPFFGIYSPSPAHYLFSKKSPLWSPATTNAGSNSNSNSNSNTNTPKRFFKRPFPPPSPAKHIRAVLARRQGTVKPNNNGIGGSIPEGSENGGSSNAGLDKRFGFSKHFGDKYEVGEEVGRGHFGYTRVATAKKGDLKGQQVAVKIIPKAKVSIHLSFFYDSFLLI